MASDIIAAGLKMMKKIEIFLKENDVKNTFRNSRCFQSRLGALFLGDLESIEDFPGRNLIEK